jgi:hypothetical protein
MTFLNATNPQDHQADAHARWWMSASRRSASANDLLKRAGPQADRRCRRPRGHRADQGAGHPLHQQEDAGRPAQEDGARLAGHRRPDYVPIIRNPPGHHESDTEAVFYFPGCGSERLFSQVGLATQAMLWHAGVQTVLPPGYLCCGYPQRGSGQFDKADKIITDNRVLFHRVANTLNYLDIKTVVVSCGTCYDQLQGYQFDKIFPGCRIIDIHEYLLEKGITLATGQGRLPVPRPLPQPDEAAGTDEDRQGLIGDQVVEERTLLRRKRHPGRDAPRHHPPRCASARKRNSARTRPPCASLIGAVAETAQCGQDPHLLPELPAGPEPLPGRPENGLLEADYIVVEMANQILGPELDAGVRRRANAGRYRAGAGVKAASGRAMVSTCLYAA